MSCPSSRRRRRDNGTATSPPAAEARDWAALPRDIVLGIFLRLGPREVMLGAEFACKPWRRAALEEPSLWRHIGTVRHWREKAMMKLVAVDRAAGQCEAFQGDCDDDYLFKLVERAPCLKDLCIISDHYSDCKSGEALVEAVMKLPLLEELSVDFNYTIIKDRDENMLRSICQACPHLKTLVLRFASIYVLRCKEVEYLKEAIDGEIPVMSELRTLELCECDLKVKGLKAILDSCPVLESLHITGFFDRREMDKELLMKCARLKSLTLSTKVSAATNSNYEYYKFDTDSLEEY